MSVGTELDLMYNEPDYIYISRAHPAKKEPSQGSNLLNIYYRALLLSTSFEMTVLILKKQLVSEQKHHMNINHNITVTHKVKDTQFFHIPKKV